MTRLSNFRNRRESWDCFFHNNGTKLALYPLVELAKDINTEHPPAKQGFSGITLFYNAKSAEEVEVIEKLNKLFWEGIVVISQIQMAICGKLPMGKTGNSMRMTC